jgi:predicted dehydrogenase
VKSNLGEGLRIAIVGSGYIARVHARTARELGGEVVAVCGRTLSSAAAFGAGAAYDNLDRLLAEQRPDVVHICTPNHLHAEQAIAALAAGAHVVCEKPLATSSEDGLRMIEAAHKARRVGAVMYNYRGYPLIAAIRDRIRRGELGRLLRIGGCYLSEDVHPADKYVWHFSPGAVGPAFSLMDLGVHWLDLAEYVTGQRVSAIGAQFSTHQPRRVWRGGPGEGARPSGRETADGGVIVDLDVEDQADLILRFDGGAGGCITVSAVSVGNPNSIRLAIDGVDLGLDWHQQEPDFYFERRPDGVLLRQRRPEDIAAADTLTFLPKGHPQGYLDAFRNVMASAWRDMVEGTALAPSFSDGLRGLQLVEAAVRSAKERRTVETFP